LQPPGAFAPGSKYARNAFAAALRTRTYSAPDRLAGTEGLLHGERKDRIGKGRKKKKKGKE